MREKVKPINDHAVSETVPCSDADQSFIEVQILSCLSMRSLVLHLFSEFQTTEVYSNWRLTVQWVSSFAVLRMWSSLPERTWLVCTRAFHSSVEYHQFEVHRRKEKRKILSLTSADTDHYVAHRVRGFPNNLHFWLTTSAHDGACTVFETIIYIFSIYFGILHK